MKLTLMLLVCLGVAACNAAGGSSQAASPHVLSIPEGDWETDEDDCIPELYAYASVLGLANQMGRDREVFDDAITDIRAQLVDCLTVQDGEVLPIRQPMRPRIRRRGSADALSTRGRDQASLKTHEQ